jgi:hypothetical protein
MHTVFRIGEMKKIVRSEYNTDNDQQRNQLTQQIREETNRSTGPDRMGHFNKAEEIYILLLQTTFGDNRAVLAHIHHQLGYIRDQNDDLSITLSHYKKSLDLACIFFIQLYLANFKYTMLKSAFFLTI